MTNRNQKCCECLYSLICAGIQNCQFLFELKKNHNCFVCFIKTVWNVSQFITFCVYYIFFTVHCLVFPPFFQQRQTFIYDFLSMSLDDETLPKRGLLLKEGKCYGVKFFPLELTLFTGQEK